MYNDMLLLLLLKAVATVDECSVIPLGHRALQSLWCGVVTVGGVFVISASLRPVGSM